ncbi:MAG: tetratricopeptide repeat protein [Desulfobacteraceae bacterium]|nr:MAG: tetratricopeptide repeat protein [Desulfobacteraceae bacterium]
MTAHLENKNALSRQIILTAVFVLLICTPIVKTLLSPAMQLSKVENRKLSQAPAIRMDMKALKSFPTKFEAYFNDQFGFRDAFIYIHNYVNATMLKISPVPDVIMGKQNWLFLKTAPYGEEKQSGKQLEAMKLHLETKRDWLAQRGIQYVFMPAPNKQSIYPEYLPENQNKKKQNLQIDDLIHYLQGTSTFMILDVRPQLRNGKDDDFVYYLTDHHWNDKGAFIAYQGLINFIHQWFPEMTPLSLQRMNQYSDISNGMSLANMMGLSDVFQETVIKLEVPRPCSHKKPYTAMIPEWNKKAGSGIEKDWYRMRIPIQSICGNADRKAIVFRDSFFDMLVPFFSEHFREAVYIWTRFDYSILPELINRIRPDIVIEECVESEIFLSHIPGEFHKTKGFDLLISGDKLGAVQEFTNDLQINPDSPDSYNNLGFALLQIREFDRAIELFQAALKLNTGHQKAAENLKLAQKTLIEIDQRVAEINHKLSLDPNHPELNIQLGNLLQKRGKTATAIPYYQKALASDPENFSALNNLAAANAYLHQFDVAIRIYQKLTLIFPDQAEVYFNLACLYSLQNNIPDAIDNLKTAVRKGYDNYNLIKTDHDLKNIRKTSFYESLVKSFHSAMPVEDEARNRSK